MPSIFASVVDKVMHFLANVPKEYYGGIIISFGIEVFYLLTLSIALSRCHPKDRLMGPFWVWMSLIPFWNIIWQFVLVNTICESLDNEFYARRLPPRGDYGKAFGIISCLCYLCTWLFIPIFWIIAGVIYFICFVVFWAKMVQYIIILMNDDAKLYDDDYDRPVRRAHRSRKNRSKIEEDDDPFHHEKYGDRRE